MRFVILPHDLLTLNSIEYLWVALKYTKRTYEVIIRTISRIL